MNRRSPFLYLSLLLLTLAACDGAATPAAPSATVRPAATRTAAPITTATVPPTPTPTRPPATRAPTAASGPAVTQTPAPAATDDPLSRLDRLAQPPPDLLVALGSMDDGWDLALASADGRLRTLVEQVAPPSYLPDFDVSPDGRQILYASAGDIWLLAIASGATENVTNTPEREEQAPRWWRRAGPATTFVCGSRPAAAEEGPADGFLTLVGFDGSYEVLVEGGQLSAPPAPGPDGQTIAYSRADGREIVPFRYRVGSGEERLDLATYGLDWVEKSWEASWSPDGRQLAWGVTGEQEGVHVAAEALLDLAGETHTLLHQYEPQPIGGYIPAPRWAPDGRWLTFMALDLNPHAAGLWRHDLAAEPGRTTQLSPYFIRPAKVRHPAVAPDEAWIAVPTYDGSAVGLIDTDRLRPLIWPVEGRVAAVGWAKQE